MKFLLTHRFLLPEKISSSKIFSLIDSIPNLTDSIFNHFVSRLAKKLSKFPVSQEQDLVFKCMLPTLFFLRHGSL